MRPNAAYRARSAAKSVRTKQARRGRIVRSASSWANVSQGRRFEYPQPKFERRGLHRRRHHLVSAAGRPVGLRDDAIERCARGDDVQTRHGKCAGAKEERFQERLVCLGCRSFGDFYFFLRFRFTDVLSLVDIQHAVEMIDLVLQCIARRDLHLPAESYSRPGRAR